MYLQLIYWVIIIFNCWKRIKIKAFINLSGMLFMYAHEIAKKIFNGEAVDMNENETELFKASIMDSTWHVFIKNAIISAIRNK